MRLCILAAALITAFPSSVRSQTFEITATAGYRFGGTLYLNEATNPGVSEGLEIADSPAYGVNLGYRFGENEIEVVYARQATTLQTGGLFTGLPLFDLTVETWQVGHNYLFDVDNPRVVPFIGVAFGLTRLLPGPPRLSDETRFSASLVGGVKLWLGRHVGMRFESRLSLNVLDSESDWLCGSGTGCLVYAEITHMSQADLRAGLILRF